MKIGGLATTMFALMAVLVPTLQPSVDAQLPNAPDDRYAGLQWRFVRIKYHYTTEGTRQQQDFYGEPWLIDGPAADRTSRGASRPRPPSTSWIQSC